MLHHLFEEGEDPFPRYRNFFNIYRLDVVSAQSGVDYLVTGTFRNTALDATYYGDGVNERLLVVNQSRAFAELLPLCLMNVVPEIRFVSVNDTRYGGAGFYSHGLYRPSFNSKMRDIYYPFDPIAREAIILQIYQCVDPLDGWLFNADPLTDPDRLWIDPIDPNVIYAQWFVDGEMLDGFTDFAFNLLDAGFGLGQYHVVARAYDPTGFDPVDGWVRIHTDRLEQFVSWTVNVTVAPEPSGLALGALAVLAAAPASLRRRGPAR